jgi:hypothetical protein
MALAAKAATVINRERWFVMKLERNEIVRYNSLTGFCAREG